MIEPDVTMSREEIAALEQLKEFIRDVAPADKIDSHAFRLIGESRETIDNETRELCEALRRQSPPLSHGMAFGLAFALRELVRERIREIEGNAS
jgi:hypothetical protein